jgi:prevent-host-death family protein
MRKVGSRELKNRLGRYLRAVKSGHTLLITDRGKPVAKLTALDEPEQREDPLTARLKELEAQGLIRLAKRPLGKFRPVRARGKPASQLIIEDRR